MASPSMVSTSSESVLDMIEDPAAVEQSVPAGETVPGEIPLDPSSLPPVTDESGSGRAGLHTSR